jgi:hypothetical protein
MSGRLVPPERQCREMVAGQRVRGVYWSPPHRCLHYAADQAKAPWLLLTLADAGVTAGWPGSRIIIPSGLRQRLPQMAVSNGDASSPEMVWVSFLVQGVVEADSLAARVSKSRLPLHIASLSMTDGIADSAWLKAARLVSRIRPLEGLRASRASLLRHRC